MTRVYVNKRALSRNEAPIIVDEDGKPRRYAWAIEGEGPFRLSFHPVPMPNSTAKVWLETEGKVYIKQPGEPPKDK